MASSDDREEAQRHYHRVLAALDTLNKGWESGLLARLASTLDFLITNARGADEVWKRGVWEHWMIVEEVNASLLDRGGTKLTDRDRGLVDGAVKAMRRLTEERIEKSSSDA